jgi:hypothetical protein
LSGVTEAERDLLNRGLVKYRPGKPGFSRWKAWVSGEKAEFRSQEPEFRMETFFGRIFRND